MPLKTSSDQKILAAATALFAKDGYRGTTTRDIARMAEVNEVTIFRHYRNKRELFRVTVETQLQSLDIEQRLSLQLATAGDPGSAVCSVMKSIAETFANKPELVRLLQFGMLEFGQEFQSLCRKYLGQWIRLLTQHLQPLAKGEQIEDLHSELLVLAFAASTLNRETFHLFSTQTLSDDEFGREYWRMWEIVLKQMPAHTCLGSDMGVEN